MRRLIGLLLVGNGVNGPNTNVYPLHNRSGMRNSQAINVARGPSTRFLTHLNRHCNFAPPRTPKRTTVTDVRTVYAKRTQTLVYVKNGFTLTVPSQRTDTMPLARLSLTMRMTAGLGHSRLLATQRDCVLPILKHDRVSVRGDNTRTMAIRSSVSVVRTSHNILGPTNMVLGSRYTIITKVTRTALPRDIMT